LLNATIDRWKTLQNRSIVNIPLPTPRPNHDNSKLFLIGEGFGFIVYFGTF